MTTRSTYQWGEFDIDNGQSHRMSATVTKTRTGGGGSWEDLRKQASREGHVWALYT